MPRLIDTGASGAGWSYYGTASLCLQKFAFTYLDPHNQRDEALIARPLRRGSILHCGLAHHYALQLGQDVYPVDEAMDMCAEKYNAEPEELADLKAIIHAYQVKYRYETWKIVDVEKLFDARVNGHRYTMRSDLIVKLAEDGKYYFVDHKSSSRPMNGMSNKYSMSGQFIAAQRFGILTWGKDFGGVIINGIPSGTNNMTFVRERCLPAYKMVDNFRDSVTHIANQIESLKSAGVPFDRWPRAMHENVCVTAYGHCPYFDRCRVGGV